MHISVEDSVLAALVDMALVLVYISVLLIKSCDVDSFWSTLNNADTIARAMCNTFGFGETADGEEKPLAFDLYGRPCALRALC